MSEKVKDREQYLEEIVMGPGYRSSSRGLKRDGEICMYVKHCVKFMAER